MEKITNHHKADPQEDGVQESLPEFEDLLPESEEAAQDLSGGTQADAEENPVSDDEKATPAEEPDKDAPLVESVETETISSSDDAEAPL